jgi:hypothetical protein
LAGFAPQHDRTTAALLLFMMRDPVKRMRPVTRYAAFSTASL